MTRHRLHNRPADRSDDGGPAGEAPPPADEDDPDRQVEPGVQAACCRSDSRADALALLLLWTAALLFFFPVLFGGQSFYFRDTLPIYYPQAMLTREALRSGELPLWNSAIGLGYPFQADPHSMVFYPLTLILLLVPMPRGYDVFVAAHVALLGTFMYALLRRWRLPAVSAAFGAAVAMFCGYTISCTSLTTLLKGSTWAPLALLCFDRFVTDGSKRALLSTAMVLAISGSGTDPQYVLFTVVLLGLSRWLRPVPPGSTAKACLLGVAGAGTLAFLLLSYQYFPLARLMQASYRTFSGGSVEVAEFDVHPANLYSLLVPIPFPDPRTSLFPASYRDCQIPLYTDLYFGLPALALAFAALGLHLGSPESRQRTRHAARAATVATVLAVLAVGLSLGSHTPIFGWLNAALPPFRYFRYPGKYFLIAAFALPLLAALGLTGLRDRHPGCCRLLGLALGTGIGSLAAAIVILGAADGVPRSFLIGQLTQLQGSATTVIEALRQAWSVQAAFAAAVGLTLAFVLLLGAREKLSPSAAAALFALLAAGDIATSTWRSMPVAEDALLAGPSVAAAQILAREPGPPPPRFHRAAGLEYTISSQHSAFDWIYVHRETLGDIRGAHLGVANLMETMSVQLASLTGLQQLMSLSSPSHLDAITRAVGARFRFEQRDFPKGATTEGLIGKWGPMLLRDLGTPCPRAFIAPTSIGASSSATSCSTSTLTALPDVAVYYRPELPPDRFVRAPAGTVKHFRLSRYEHSRIEAEFELAGDGMFVVLDAYYPGWRATVDGEARDIHRVAGLFRGVFVRQGDRRITMTYGAPEFHAGLAVSLLALLAWAWFWRRAALPGTSDAPTH